MSGQLASNYPKADDSPGLLLWRTTNAWQAKQRAALKPFDLTHVQFVLLAHLTFLDCQAFVTQRELADQTAIDPMMVSQVLRTLESKGFVARRNHPEDSRAKAVHATTAGRDLTNVAIGAVEDVDQKFFTQLGSHLSTFTADLLTLSKSRS